MRRIVLELAEDTTSELCGSCRKLTAFRGNVILARSCAAFRVTMDTKGPAKRVDECLSAERTFSRLLDVSPEDALAACESTNNELAAFMEANERIEAAITAHAKKAEVKP